MLELKNKVTCIFGLRGSGKTTLAHTMATECGDKVIVYDTQHEFPKDAVYGVYQPKDRYSINELFALIHAYTIYRPMNSKLTKPDYIFIDEANRFFPGGGKALDPRAVDLNDSVRHPPYELGLILIARRPTQLHPDIVGLSDSVIVFGLSGKNDIQYLNDLYVGMGDKVQQLKPYHAIILTGNQLKYIEPIQPDDIWMQHQKRNM